MFTVHYYNQNGERLLDITNIRPEDAKFLQDNDIKVSMEELNGEIIVYGCPYSDTSEESEVIVFAGNNNCENTMSELVAKCKEHFGVEE